MKINPLDAHDRLLHVHKTQTENISECCRDLIEKKPFGDNPFYIFAHPRTEDDGVNKRLVWQPRLGKPKAQTNSMLFKAYPGLDEITVVWIIPPREMWAQYQIDFLTASKTVLDSIHAFEHDREFLERPEEDDPSPERIQEILFEFQPQLFKRDTLPEGKRAIWDRRMKEKNQEKNEV
jgi:hypothetical protein